MKKKFLNILPFLVTSLIVIGFWKLWTWTDNYAWNPKGKELLMLDIALTSIFFYKTVFWLVVANLTVFAVRQGIKKNFKIFGVTTFLTVAIYFFVGNYVDKKCAFHYYVVFKNQSVTEEYILEPILQAGQHIGHILTEKITDRDMKYRRYAINGLEKLKYKPATQTLKEILFDKSEVDVYRADAFIALRTFDTDETRKIVSTFRQHATDTLDKKVIHYVDYWTNNN